MKTLIIFILLFIGCKPVEKAYTNNSVDIQIAEQVRGNWQLCSTKIGDDFLMSNICQSIKFDENGSGSSLMGDNLTCQFKWKCKNNYIIFSFASSEDQSNFLYGDLKYTYRLYDKEDKQYLEIRPKEGEVIYFLVRAKKK